MAWRAERIWDGQTVVIVAGGESVTCAQIRCIAMARARNRIRVIAVNDAAFLCWWADVAYACDKKWWRFHGGLTDFPGERVTLEAPVVEGIRQMRNTGKEGFDPDPSALRTGGNSGYQALHLAAHFGARKVILVGYDMRGRHWFGDHPPLIAASALPIKTFLRLFQTIVEPLSERGVRVVNGTPNSELKVFPMVDLARELTAMERPHGSHKQVGSDRR